MSEAPLKKLKIESLLDANPPKAESPKLDKKIKPLFPDFEPQEELLKGISDFLYLNVGDRPYVEVEAKFGILIDKSTQKRISLPVQSECSRYKKYASSSYKCRELA
jgi:hypothetical protein